MHFWEVEHLSQSVGCARKQTVVSHSWTESEVISLDAGLRMNGLLAFDLLDIVIEVLHSTKDNIQPKHNWPPGKLEQFLIPKRRPNMLQENRRLTKRVRWITYQPTHFFSQGEFQL